MPVLRLNASINSYLVPSRVRHLITLIWILKGQASTSVHHIKKRNRQVITIFPRIRKDVWPSNNPSTLWWVGEAKLYNPSSSWWSERPKLKDTSSSSSDPLTTPQHFDGSERQSCTTPLRLDGQRGQSWKTPLHLLVKYPICLQTCMHEAKSICWIQLTSPVTPIAS
jgi:hypothetical protein